MAATDVHPWLVWLLVAALGAGVYAMRLSFIHLCDAIERIPPRLERALSLIPAAILAALVTPALFPLEGSATGAVFNLRALAGAIALATAWRTGSMSATIGVGMGVLWTGTVLLG
jgi:branched-subunit amino acid transport protein